MILCSWLDEGSIYVHDYINIHHPERLSQAPIEAQLRGISRCFVHGRACFRGYSPGVIRSGWLRDIQRMFA